MTARMWLSQQASIPAPADVATYLLSQGWRLLSSNALWAVYARQPNNPDLSIEVPQQASTDDYPRVFGLLLEDLAVIEHRSPFEVLRDIKASSMDIIRLAIDSAATEDGRIPVEAGYRVYEASRNLLLAAACSAIDPRPVFAKRKPDDAMKLLERARFGQTEIGSFVLTMECNISPRLGQLALTDKLTGEDLDSSLMDIDPDAPLERRASTKLAQALREAETATRESAASDTIDPFVSRARIGVSSNLCDAVAELIEATSANTLTASFSYAARRPLAPDIPRRVVFSSDTAPILREAAARLRDESPCPEADIMGFVVKLDSPDPSKGGSAVLKAMLDGKMRSIRVSLDAAPYVEAIRAHQERAVVQCVGDLIRERQSFALRNVREFRSLLDT